MTVARLAKPDCRDDARRRRRDVIVVLGGLAVITLLAGVLIGGAAIAVHLLVDVALVGYVMAVAQRQRIATERREKVTPLRPAPVALAAASHDDLLRQSGT